MTSYLIHSHMSHILLFVSLVSISKTVVSIHANSTSTITSHVTTTTIKLSGDDCNKQLFNLALLPSPEAHLRTPELIVKYGYPVEKHVVTSKDGYILTLFRIPHGSLNTKTADNFPDAPEAGLNRPVVLLQHGLMATSADWLMQPGDDSLPFMLANAGYDVWLGNARGTSYSNKHTRLNTAQLKYWRFSWNEMGKFDIPATIDYILALTKEPKLYYIGHSMGGSMFFVAMSLHPEYNDKIRSMYGLAPAVYMEHIATPMIIMEPFAKPMERINDMMGIGSFLSPRILQLLQTFGPLICAPSQVALRFCGWFFFMSAGYNPCQFNTTQQISKITGHTPDTISFWSLTHYLQLRHSRRFCAYDHGSAENKRLYGQTTPPDYDLSKVTAKAAVFWGENDLLVSPQDTRRLVRELPNVIANHRINFDLWNHVDFIYGIDAKPLVYDEVMRLMAKNY